MISEITLRNLADVWEARVKHIIERKPELLRPEGVTAAYPLGIAEVCIDELRSVINGMSVEQACTTGLYSKENRDESVSP